MTSLMKIQNNPRSESISFLRKQLELELKKYEKEKEEYESYRTDFDGIQDSLVRQMVTDK